VLSVEIRVPPPTPSADNEIMQCEPVARQMDIDRQAVMYGWLHACFERAVMHLAHICEAQGTGCLDVGGSEQVALAVTL
jgi:nitroreductase